MPIAALALLMSTTSEIPTGAGVVASLTAEPALGGVTTEITIYSSRDNATRSFSYWVRAVEPDRSWVVDGSSCLGIVEAVQELSRLSLGTIAVPGQASVRQSPPHTDSVTYTLETSHARQANGYSARVRMASNGGELERWGERLVNHTRLCAPVSIYDAP